MIDSALVSIVTPTFPGRENVLLKRCMPSVYAQTWPNIEFVVISDKNPDIEQQLYHQHGTSYSNAPDDSTRQLRVVELNDTWKNQATKTANGALPWYVGSLVALGDYISFLGDDDELMPDHVQAHVHAMTAKDAMWSVSKIEFQADGEFWNVIGDDSFVEGHLDATGIMCRTEALRTANWDPAAGIAAVDWKLVNDWRQAGLPGVFIDHVTGIHHDGWLTGQSGKPYA